MVTRIVVTDIEELGPKELGMSGWREIAQRDIDAFATTTGDAQWIHVDVDAATAGPFGTTIAHGYLVLALLPVLLNEVLELGGLHFAVNYGVDRLRFTGAVPAGSRVRLNARIVNIEPRRDAHLLRLASEVEVEGAHRPALVGEFLFLLFADK